MEELSDYIYLLIGIIIFVASIMRKATKKQLPPKPAAVQETHEEHIADEIFEPSSSTDNIHEEKFRRTIIQDTSPDTHKSTEPAELLKPEEEGLSTSGKKEDVKAGSEASISKKIKKQPKKKFNLKDAVIYSEIINRKY